jgi:hypothetical protein
MGSIGLVLLLDRALFALKVLVILLFMVLLMKLSIYRRDCSVKPLLLVLVPLRCRCSSARRALVFSSLYSPWPIGITRIDRGSGLV